MKLINVYKQDDINWFNYKYLFSYSNKLYEQPNIKELELKSWIGNPHIHITKRKPYEAS